LAEREVSRLRLVGADDHHLPRRIGGDVLARVELGTLVGVGDDHLRSACQRPLRDGGGSERREQRHLHRAQAPDPEQNTGQGDAFAHQGGHPVSRTDAQPRQRRGDPLRGLPQLPVCQVHTGQILLDDRERHRVGGMAVAQQLCGTHLRLVDLLE